MAKGKVMFNENRCKGCEICIEVCPKNIIEMNKSNVNVKGYHAATVKEENIEECIACGNCAVMCPDCVISVYAY